MVKGWADTLPLGDDVRDGFFLWARCSYFGLQGSDQRRTEFAVDALGRVSIRALLAELRANLAENSLKGSVEDGAMAVAGLIPAVGRGPWGDGSVP